MSIGRGPCRTPPARRPSSDSISLHFLEELLRAELCLDLDHRVEEVRLVEHLALGRGLVDR